MRIVIEESNGESIGAAMASSSSWLARSAGQVFPIVILVLLEMKTFYFYGDIIETKFLLNINGNVYDR
jgi:hypothetical protein